MAKKWERSLLSSFSSQECWLEPSFYLIVMEINSSGWHEMKIQSSENSKEGCGGFSVAAPHFSVEMKGLNPLIGTGNYGLGSVFSLYLLSFQHSSTQEFVVGKEEAEIFLHSRENGKKFSSQTWAIPKYLALWNMYYVQIPWSKTNCPPCRIREHGFKVQSEDLW